MIDRGTRTDQRMNTDVVKETEDGHQGEGRLLSGEERGWMERTECGNIAVFCMHHCTVKC